MSYAPTPVSIAKYPKARTRLRTLDHYLLAAYESTEAHSQCIVIIDPTVTEPTALLRAGTRVDNRTNRYALILPRLEALTCEVAAEHTRMLSGWWGLREWSESARQTGVAHAAGLPLVVSLKVRG